MKQGILYGVGVGPGDPELMTRKAVRILETCDVIAAPQSEGTTKPLWPLRPNLYRTNRWSTSICP